MSPGPPDEQGQKVCFLTHSPHHHHHHHHHRFFLHLHTQLTFAVEVDKPGMFATLPTISVPGGDLAFELVPDVNGDVVVGVVLLDDGGTDNGGVDRTDRLSFRIMVRPLNDQPTFNPGDRIVRGVLNSGAVVVPWATDISAGPSDEQQKVTFVLNVLNPNLFAPDGQPSIGSDGALRYTPAPGVFGNTTVVVTAVDSAGLRSVPTELTIVVAQSPQGLPSTPAPQLFPTINNQPSEKEGFPPWAIPLIIVGALLLIGCIAAAIFAWRKLRKDEDSDDMKRGKAYEAHSFPVSKDAAPFPSAMTSGTVRSVVDLTKPSDDRLAFHNPIDSAFAVQEVYHSVPNTATHAPLAYHSEQQPPIQHAGSGYDSIYNADNTAAVADAPHSHPLPPASHQPPSRYASSHAVTDDEPDVLVLPEHGTMRLQPLPYASNPLHQHALG